MEEKRLTREDFEPHVGTVFHSDVDGIKVELTLGEVEDRSHLATKVVQGNRDVYERQVLPDYKRRHGREPADRREVFQGMRCQPFYRMWGALQRSSQEMDAGVWLGLEKVFDTLDGISEAA